MKTLKFLGVSFWNLSTKELLTEADENGGLLVVPSAPSLSQMANDGVLKKAHEEADYAVVDGGYVAMVLRLLGKKVVRISGLQILEKTVIQPEKSVIPMMDRRIFWVVPDENEEGRIKELLAKRGFGEDQMAFYQAPFYQHDDDFDDVELHQRISRFGPDWVVLCLSGGKQEKVGHFLRSYCQNLAKTGLPPSWGRVSHERPNGPLVFCTGAAISFFTGSQAKIPKWADRLYLGWLFRTCREPRVFLPRYCRALWQFPWMLVRERKSLFS